MANRKRKLVNKKSHKRKQISPKKRTTKGYSQLFKEVRLFLLVLVIMIIIFSGILSFFLSIKKVSGYGMLPSLRDKDILIIQKKAELRRFDLVYLRNGIEGEFRRIIGLPGEKIEVNNDVLLVNDEPFDEKYLVDKINAYQIKGKKFTEDFYLSNVRDKDEIPKEFYLVLGDNRPYTTDSRDYGLVSSDAIVGKVIMRVFPLERAKSF